MIEKHFKKYLKRPDGDLADRRLRSWSRVYNHIQAEQPAPQGYLRFADMSFWKELGAVPAMVMLMLVIFGAGTASALENSLPGEKLYVVKRAVEETHLRLATTESAKENIQIQMIEKRAVEVAKLESKIELDGQVTPAERAKVEQVKEEMGKNVIALVSKDPTLSLASEKGENGNPLVSSRRTAMSPFSPQERIAYAEMADAKMVGDAVAQMLKNSPASAGLKDIDLKKVVVKIVEDTKVAAEAEKLSEDQKSQDKPKQPIVKEAPKVISIPEPIEPAPVGEGEESEQGSLIIEGEVESSIEVQ